MADESHGLSVLDFATPIAQLTDIISTTANKGLDIVTILTEIPAFDLPKSLLTAVLPDGTKVKINASTASLGVTSTEMPGLSAGRDFKTYTLNAPPCHGIDLGSFGSLLKMMMVSIQKVVDGVISEVFDTLAKVIEMFFNIADYAKDLKEWLNSIITGITESMKSAFKNIKKAETDLNKNVQLTKGIPDPKKVTEILLYKRVAKFYTDFWEKKLQPWLKKLNDSVFDFVDYIVIASEEVWPIIKDIMDKVTKIPEVLTCLTKNVTKAMAT
jgi:hypothetical protein